MPVAPFQARSLERETSQDRVERAIQARQGVRSKKALRGRCVGSTQDPSSDSRIPPGFLRRHHR